MTYDSLGKIPKKIMNVINEIPVTRCYLCEETTNELTVETIISHL